ncbi:NAD(P)H-dependent flavin oxidoreductase [Planococcus glaciei]|uniref:NAD(P)H-dependent flavin oxidoreductase n=1 Tax=Planococcus glaciei TaxID=459472 RepID=UPI001C7309B6|nr:nitronate monooxygenase [Planococcus glaciei]MBX0315432.1 nitronate monooxygenase [Planococcus glaciei]
MIETRITEMFGIKYPIIQGGLQGLGTSSLVSAVSNAGGLGLITAGSYSSKKDMLQDIEKTRTLTSNPFGMNAAIGIRRPMDEFIEGAIEAKLPAVFTSGNNPQQYIEQLKNNGIKVVHVVPSIRFAKKAEAIGCDAVVVVGYECGGHPGQDDITTMMLTQRAVQELSIPVIAAGGISTGKSALAAFALGAQGVQMGTRFLTSTEVGLHPSVKERILKLQETDTVLVKKSIKKTARVMKTENALALRALEEGGATLEEIMPYISGESYQQLIYEGKLDQGVIALGQSIGLVNEIKTVNEIFHEIINEYNEQLNSLYAARQTSLKTVF